METGILSLSGDPAGDPASDQAGDSGGDDIAIVSASFKNFRHISDMTCNKCTRRSSRQCPEKNNRHSIARLT